ncbi:MAG: DUF86 domain-containing protein [Pyrobaculum arsenaticum]|uniref:DUF86 domain-containing protein n=1 Tax=Pyrobaculum arsenaticum TaxID=121277 RepID=UPI002274BF8C|nr:DUF86 domain-containing protein [Pyrobaculum arsenaticum]
MGSLERLLKLLLQYTSYLDGLNADDLSDVYKYLSAVYLLQVQALIDIAVKAAAALGLGVEGYIDAGNKLKSAGILSDEEFRRYRTVVRFRNIVVHQYDIEIIRRIIERREYRDVARMGIKIVEEVRRRTRKN